MRTVTVIAILVAIAVAGFFGFIYSGIYQIAAREPHLPPIRWVIETVKRNSIERKASGIAVPPTLDDPEMVRKGASRYAALCTTCHDSPSRIRPLMALRMRPRPPPMTVPAERRKPNELFWIVENGIKMTGMPSWGAALSDPDIWAIVAFIEKLPTMTADDYQALLPGEHAPAHPARRQGAAGTPPSGGAHGMSAAATVEISAAGEFEPAKITIAEGETVAWVNTSGVPHSVTLDPQAASDPRHVALPRGAAGFNSGFIGPGGHYRHRFITAGRYRYFCIPHEKRGMTGEITVVERSADRSSD